MATITLAEAVEARRTILLDTNVLPHFVGEAHRTMLEKVGVNLKPASRKFDAVKLRLRGKLSTSLINVVECMAGHKADVEIAEVLLTSLVGSVSKVWCPDAAQTKALTLYVARGAISEKAFAKRIDLALASLNEVEAKKFWIDPATAKINLDRLRQLVGAWPTRDRGWPDVYTAQTALDNNLVVLTEDAGDFRGMNNVHLLSEYNMSGT